MKKSSLVRAGLLLCGSVWWSASAVAGELLTMTYQDAAAKHASIVDVRSSNFYQGWPMEGEQQGGHVVGAVNISGDWKITDEQWPRLLAEKKLTKDQPVALYGDKRQVAEVAQMLERKHGFTKLYELADWQSAPRERLARWQQLVYPQWLESLRKGEKIVEAPKGDWKLFEVDWGAPKTFLLGHIPGAGYIDTNAIESEPLWNKVANADLEKFLLGKGIRHDTTVILYGRNTMAAARAAQIMMYAGVEDVRLLDGGFEAWKNQYVRMLPTETGLPKEYAPAKDFGVTIPQHPEYLIDVPGAKKVLAEKDGALVSVRSWPEFTGETSGYSYIKPKGDIPGAKWGHAGVDANDMSDYHNPDGTMKDASQIVDMWAQWGITPDKQVSFYCGTGWRASEAFYYAWLMDWKRISVYDGGWYEWSMDPKNPIATGERKPN
ncbi:thiosulfate sulfurtransferase [Aeromonas sp. RU39B]|uniref:rhodanese-like domain-containing protein n=1 Tax=Aeromonas sp. RU39B TaxID=1907416 RepID=UPI000953CA47|nr:rhodanese-like domain-containing protein [Aeromonas sp. RU39B]SIR51504.1 thiosulfate sulfurtransferase [Aeromonas sp. RU39B]